MLFLLLACSGPTSDDTADAPSVCWDDLARGEAVTLAAGFSDGTEGISFVDGHLLVSFPTGVREVGPDGTLGEPTVLDHALGLAPAPGGVLVADPGEFTFDGSGDDGGVRYVSTVRGYSASLVTGLPNPNFLAASPWGDVLLSDDTGESIYAVDYSGGAGVSTWLDGVPSPNGMGFSPDGGTLYVVSTFEPEPPLWRVPVTDGTPGTPEILASFDTGSAPDGLAVAADGAIFVAANLAGEVIRVNPTGETETVGNGLTNPASLAFGQGDGFDPCSIYYTELYGEEVGRLAVGVEGLPLTVAPAPPDI